MMDLERIPMDSGDWSGEDGWMGE